MDKLRVAIIQSNLFWENKKDNLAQFKRKLNALDQVDLVILPEMFNSGFTMNTSNLAEEINDTTTLWLKETALENNFAIMGSCIIKEGSDYFNRLLMAYPCSSVKWYDKRHLFRMGNEHLSFSAGTKQQIFNYLGWKIMPQICYDLRFPIWSRNTQNYDLLVYVANWPKVRNDAWKTLLKARAIENQCYVIGVNRVGTDANQIEYSGDSMLIDPKGTTILTLEPEKEGIGTAEISLESLNKFREKFPVYLDADKFFLEK